MLSALLLEYIIFVDDNPYHPPTQQSGNMALFVTLFLICAIEVMVVKIVTEEDREAADIAEAALHSTVASPPLRHLQDFDFG